MSKRLAILAASTALVTLSTPAAAQVVQVDESYTEAVDAVMRGGRAVEGWADEPQVGVDFAEPDAVDAVIEDAAYDYEQREVVQSYDQADEGGEWVEERGTDAGLDDAGDVRRGHHRRGHHRGRHAMQPQTPRLAYGPAERAEWLAQCRSLHARPVEPVYFYEDENDADEGLIGGLLGAVVGGVIGNRVNDSDRLLGTVIGAGAGGLAGAVIGSVIDGLGDDADERPVAHYADEEPRFDYCEAYLLNYERGYGTPVQVAYAPVMMVPVAQQPMQRQVHQRRYRMIEEEVEVEAPTRDHHIRHVTPPRDHGKLEQIN